MAPLKPRRIVELCARLRGFAADMIGVGLPTRQGVSVALNMAERAVSRRVLQVLVLGVRETTNSFISSSQDGPAILVIEPKDSRQDRWD